MWRFSQLVFCWYCPCKSNTVGYRLFHSKLDHCLHFERVKTFRVQYSVLQFPLQSSFSSLCSTQMSWSTLQTTLSSRSSKTCVHVSITSAPCPSTSLHVRAVRKNSLFGTSMRLIRRSCSFTLVMTLGIERIEQLKVTSKFVTLSVLQYPNF